MTEQQLPISYYVPGEIILGFEVVMPPPALRENPFFSSQTALAKYLTDRGFPLPGKGFALDSGITVRQFQSIFPVIQNPENATLLATMQLNDDAELPDYVERMFERVLADRDQVARAGIPKLVSITPNWFVGTSQGGIGTGGPGGQPTRATGPGVFNLPPMPVSKNVEQKIQEVDVFILDTIYAFELDKSVGTTDEPSGTTTVTNGVGIDKRKLDIPPVLENRNDFKNHPLGKAILGELSDRPGGGLQSPDGKFEMVWADDIHQGSLNNLKNTQGHPLWAADLPAYDMSDHGPFIAGTIMQIAPSARIHLIQVLNEYGVGTLASIAAGFSQVSEHFESGNTTNPVVVNCSFTLAFPIDGDRSTANRAGHSTKNLNPKMQALALSPHYILEITSLFNTMLPFGADQSKCIIVAAAGNDSVSGAIRPARFPAHIDMALGVGALEPIVNPDPTVDPARAVFSNLADRPACDGLMVLGEMRGVFTRGFLDGSLNSTGFATWKGTSFATGVMSGLIARLCGEHGLTPGDARDYLRNLQQSNTSESEEIVRVEQQ